MEVHLLGPLEMTGPDGRVRISGTKERLVLALLVLRAGQVVSRDALVDALWGDDPPATAVKTMQGYVARVRKALEAAGMADVLTTRAPGYVLHPSFEPTDVGSFERHATAGHAALVDGDPARAKIELSKALELWRGDALVDCRGGGWAKPEALRLDELRLSTVEDRVDADLMLGHHGAAVGELESLVTTHPLRERLWAALMLALHRSGRQADALRAYQRARGVLVAELGLEPGAELRRLEAAVLAGDPTLDAPDPGPVPTTGDRLEIPLPRRVERATSAVFVGRAHEREGLQRSLEAVATGERRVVLVSGEPGIGKTSLSASFAREAFLDDAVVLYGRCDEDLGIPYQPWIDALVHLVRYAPEWLLDAHVEDRGSELARLVPDLARRVGDGGRSSTDPEADRYLLFGAVVDVFARVGALRPVVLVLDDLHWADRPTLQLLRHVVSADVALRLLVVGTFRDSDVGADHPLVEVLAAMHRDPGIERLTLRGLRDDELLLLLETASGQEPLEERLALRDALIAETDGNPFFVGELLRHEAETRSMDQDGEGRRLTTTDPSVPDLPVSLREVIGHRVARLGAETQRVLSLAAVVGREFDVHLLAMAAELAEEVLGDLCDQAVLASLLAEGDLAGRYMFKHALIEHALYDHLSAGRRARAHGTIAEALEEVCGDHPGERIGELAYHWAHATQRPNVGKAIFYAQRAGDRALAQLAPDEAVRWYQDALTLLEGSGDDDSFRRGELLLALGDAQRQIGDPVHRETLLAAGRLADQIGAIDILVRAALRNNRGWNSIVGGVDHDRVAMLRRALTRLDGTDSPDRARLLALLCVEVTWDCDFDERLSLATEAVDTARRLHDDAALVDAIRHSHESITMPQTLALRRRWNAEACELADRLGDPNALLHANDYRMYAALEAGDVATMDAARAVFDSTSERIGQPLNRWQVAYHASWQRALEGDVDAALQSTDEALALGTAAGFADDALTIYRFQRLSLRYMQGRLQRRSRSLSQPPPQGPGLDIFRVTTAFVTSLGESPQEVTLLLDEEVQNDFPMFADSTWLVAQVLWAEAAARSGHRPASTLLYRRLLPWHDQLATSHISVHGGVAHYLGLLAHTLGLHADADGWFDQALTFHEALRAPFFVAWTQAAWAVALSDRDLPGDTRRAHPLAQAALRVATERRYGYVERDARSVLDRLA